MLISSWPKVAVTAAKCADLLHCDTKSALAVRCTWVSSFLWIPALRSLTPPDLKWLLVERATLAGDLLQMELRRAELTAEIAKTKSRVQALDTTIRLCHSNARPDAAGAVRRHTPGYGRRGALKGVLISSWPKTSSSMGIGEQTIFA